MGAQTSCLLSDPYVGDKGSIMMGGGGMESRILASREPQGGKKTTVSSGSGCLVEPEFRAMG